MLGQGFQAKLFPEICFTLVGCLCACGTIHRVCATTWYVLHILIRRPQYAVYSLCFSTPFQLIILDIRLVFREQNFAESTKFDCPSRCAYNEEEEKVNASQQQERIDEQNFQSNEQNTTKLKILFFLHILTFID